MSFCFIILAAGNSLRFNSLTPKPYQKIGGKSLIEININKASKIKEIKKIVLVYNKKHIKYLKKLKLKKIKLIEGGNSRQMSTFKSLKYLFNHSKIKSVLIHDCARPNFSNELLQKLIKKKMKNKVVVPVIKIEDAIKQKIGNNNIQHVISKKRDDLFLTQTPQCFDLTEIYKLHKNKKDRYKDDDLSLFENFNDVKFIEGNKNNFKITDEQDFEKLKKIFKSNLRYGIGFDIHKLASGRKLYLGGLKIKSKVGTLGHSDGDPVLHAIIDSILGAAALGNIGSFFPNKDKKYKNIRSTVLLEKILNKLDKENIFLNNIDINIIAQKPNINNLQNHLKKNIAKLCNISVKQISIKGKTTEKLGIIGKEKAIACEVITSILKYD